MPTLQELADGMPVEGFFAVREMTLRETRTGTRYIRLILADATGTMVANVWDASEELHQSLTGAEVVKVRASVETYRNALQMNVARIRAAAPHEIDRSALVPETPCDREALREELRGLVDTITDEDYLAICHQFLDDAEWLESFSQAPAARTLHHAYLGGLLEHTVSVMRIADRYASVTPSVRRDLLLAGAFLHDIGKVSELQVATAIDYTDEGTLVGHLIQGLLAIEARIAQLPSFPPEKRNLLYHLVLSHHGRHEYGSPVLPAVPEAVALHHLDNLDAKVFAAHKAIDEDTDPTRHWTQRSYALDTRVFKG